MADKAGKKDKKTTSAGTDKINIPFEDSAVRKALLLKLICLLSVVVFITYANTLKNNYALDDYAVKVDNAIVKKGTGAIPLILSTPYRYGYQKSDNDFYRPLSLVTFALEIQLFGMSPLPSHLINIILFAGCVIMLFLFLDKIAGHKSTIVAFLAALLFALHPIHTEIVANVKGRDELLCFLFAFLSLVVFVKYMDKGKIIHLLIGCGILFLAFLSKETVTSFIFIVPFVFFYYLNKNRQRAVYVTLGLIAVFVVFLLVRNAVLEKYGATHIAHLRFIDNQLSKEGLDDGSRIATAILIMGMYIKLLIIPYPLICDYSFSTIQFVDFSEPLVLLSLVVYIFLIVFAVKRWLKNRQDLYAFAILFFIASLFLFSNIPFLIGAAMGERFLFFASAGFCTVLALLIRKLAGGNSADNLSVFKNVKMLVVIVPLLLIYAAITISRNSVWKDNYTLYTTDLKTAPDNAKLNYFAGMAVKKLVKETNDRDEQIKLEEEALTDFKKAATIYPAYDDAITAIGGLFFEEGQYKQALMLCKAALDINPDMPDNYSNVGLCYYHLGHYDSAARFLNRAIEMQPGSVSAYENILLVYKALGSVDSVHKYDMLVKKYRQADNGNR